MDRGRRRALKVGSVTLSSISLAGCAGTVNYFMGGESRTLPAEKAVDLDEDRGIVVEDVEFYLENEKVGVYHQGERRAAFNESEEFDVNSFLETGSEIPEAELQSENNSYRLVFEEEVRYSIKKEP